MSEKKNKEKCYYCGRKLKHDKKFCAHCGRDNSISDERKKQIFDMYFDSM